MIGLPASRLVIDSIALGGQYGSELATELEFYGEQLGIPPDALFGVLVNSYLEEQR